jgi:hypothetical protein
MGLSKEFIVKTYKDMVEIRDGKLIGEHVFRRKSRICSAYWQGRYWRCWSEFQAELGFKPNLPNTRTPNEVLLQRYAELALELKKIPTHVELILRHKADPSFPDAATYWHLGRREARLDKLVAYCEGKSELAPVVELIRRDRERAQRVRRRPTRNVQGIVYLSRRGSDYRIARIHASGRRHSVESVLLARRPDTVHAISTDDPEGIEFYWRRRFRLRRQGRNSFRLSDDDLAAFRNRRFQ